MTKYIALTRVELEILMHLDELGATNMSTVLERINSWRLADELPLIPASSIGYPIRKFKARGIIEIVGSQKARKRYFLYDLTQFGKETLKANKNNLGIE